MNKKKLPLAFWIFIGLVVGIAVGLALMMVPNGLDIAKNYILPWGTIFPEPAEIHRGAHRAVFHRLRCHLYAGHRPGGLGGRQDDRVLHVHHRFCRGVGPGAGQRGQGDAHLCGHGDLRPGL